MVKVKDNALKTIISTETLLSPAIFRLVDVNLSSKIIVALKKNHSLKGVKINKSKEIESIDIRVIVNAGYNLNDEGYEAIESIREALVNMLGDLIKHNYVINIYIEGIRLKQEE